jgi:hypothetical protein
MMMNKDLKMKKFIVYCWARNRQTELDDIRDTFTVYADSAEAALIRAKELEPRGYEFEVYADNGLNVKPWYVEIEE